MLEYPAVIVNRVFLLIGFLNNFLSGSTIVPNQFEYCLQIWSEAYSILLQIFNIVGFLTAALFPILIFRKSPSYGRRKRQVSHRTELLLKK